MRVLYAGDNSRRGAARYLITVMENSHIDYEYFPPSNLQEIPSNLTRLSKFDAVILSDAPANGLGKERMSTLEEYVMKGGGLAMMGGWGSFTGSNGNYKGTPVEKALPVSCLASDDRNNDSNGFKIIKKQEHPILQGLPWNNAPTVCGYNMVVPKDGSEILLTLRGIESLGEDRIERIKLSEKEHPLLIINDYGKGKALAFTTDIAPHWAGGMVDWGSERIKKGNCELGSLYAQFLYQMIDWLGE